MDSQNYSLQEKLELFFTKEEAVRIARNPKFGQLYEHFSERAANLGLLAPDEREFLARTKDEHDSIKNSAMLLFDISEFMRHLEAYANDSLYLVKIKNGATKGEKLDLYNSEFNETSALRIGKDKNNLDMIVAGEFTKEIFYENIKLAGIYSPIERIWLDELKAITTEKAPSKKIPPLKPGEFGFDDEKTRFGSNTTYAFGTHKSNIISPAEAKNIVAHPAFHDIMRIFSGAFLLLKEKYNLRSSEDGDLVGDNVPDIELNRAAHALSITNLLTVFMNYSVGKIKVLDLNGKQFNFDNNIDIKTGTLLIKQNDDQIISCTPSLFRRNAIRGVIESTASLFPEHRKILNILSKDILEINKGFDRIF